jgi:hypothetical protein
VIGSIYSSAGSGSPEIEQGANPVSALAHPSPRYIRLTGLRVIWSRGGNVREQERPIKAKRDETRRAKGELELPPRKVRCRLYQRCRRLGSGLKGCGDELFLTTILRGPCNQTLTSCSVDLTPSPRKESGACKGRQELRRCNHFHGNGSVRHVAGGT